jgi:hypothetical protein
LPLLLPLHFAFAPVFAVALASLVVIPEEPALSEVEMGDLLFRLCSWLLSLLFAFAVASR